MALGCPWIAGSSLKPTSNEYLSRARRSWAKAADGAKKAARSRTAPAIDSQRAETTYCIIRPPFESGNASIGGRVDRPQLEAVGGRVGGSRAVWSARVASGCAAPCQVLAISTGARLRGR